MSINATNAPTANRVNPLALEQIDSLDTNVQRATAMLSAVTCCKGEATFWHMHDELQDAYLGMIGDLIAEISASAQVLFSLATKQGEEA
jgi:hypothetical protein